MSYIPDEIIRKKEIKSEYQNLEGREKTLIKGQKLPEPESEAMKEPEPKQIPESLEVIDNYNYLETKDIKIKNGRIKSIVRHERLSEPTYGYKSYNTVTNYSEKGKNLSNLNDNINKTYNPIQNEYSNNTYNFNREKTSKYGHNSSNRKNENLIQYSDNMKTESIRQYSSNNKTENLENFSNNRRNQNLVQYSSNRRTPSLGQYSSSRKAENNAQYSNNRENPSFGYYLDKNMNTIETYNPQNYNNHDNCYNVGQNMDRKEIQNSWQINEKTCNNYITEHFIICKKCGKIIVCRKCGKPKRPKELDRSTVIGNIRQSISREIIGEQSSKGNYVIRYSTENDLNQTKSRYEGQRIDYQNNINEDLSSLKTHYCPVHGYV